MTYYPLIFHMFLSSFLGGGILLSVAGHFKGGWAQFLLSYYKKLKFLSYGWFLLLVPIIILGNLLYPWGEFHGNKEIYFNFTFLLIRQLLYVGLILLGAFILPRRPWASLIIFILVGSFLVFDWALAFEVHWFSNMYGFIYLTSGVLAAMSLMFLRSLPEDEVARKDLVHLYLATTLFWFYLHCCQFLIIWMGNLPREVGWYNVRLTSGMFTLFVLVPILKVIPVFVLSFNPQEKAKPKWIKTVAIFSLISFVLEIIWLLLPSMKGGV